VTTLELGLYLPPKTIFCSSLPDYGIPNGLRFIDYIRDTIDEAKLAIFLVAAHFLKSEFCFAEFGAAWVKSIDQMVLLVAPLTPSNLTGIFSGIQTGVLTDRDQLNQLKRKIAVALGSELVRDDRWEKARDDFLKYANSLPSIDPQATGVDGDAEVTIQELKEVKAALANSQADLVKSREELTNCRVDLTNSQADLTKARKDLATAHKEMTHSQADLLRRAWSWICSSKTNLALFLGGLAIVALFI